MERKQLWLFLKASAVAETMVSKAQNEFPACDCVLRLLTRPSKAVP